MKYKNNFSIKKPKGKKIFKTKDLFLTSNIVFFQ